MKRNKIVSLTLAGTLAVTAMFAGTYAWKSVSQKAKNQVEQTVNPGARLHDDFDFLSNGNKDVYVENFTTVADDGVAVYARIRLDEYLEIGTEAGDTNRANDNNVVIIADAGTTPQLTNESTWTTYKWEREKLIENGQTPIKQNEPSEFRKYFLWNQDGNAQTTAYMPTFNKDKDGLEADINGTLEGKDGTKTNPYDDNIVYAAGETVTNIAIYDADDDDHDDVTGSELQEIIDKLTSSTTATLASGDDVTSRTWDMSVIDPTSGGTPITTVQTAGGTTYNIHVVLNTGSTAVEYIDVALATPTSNDYNVRLKQETHTAATTLASGGIISMEKWKASGSTPGDYWVYDTDGWVYWANPISPSATTSLLLDKIEIRNDTSIEDKYYYAINVVGEFSTKSEDGTWANFTGASADAKLLLNNASGVAYDKYTVTVTSNGTATTVNAAQDSSIRLNAAVAEGATAQTPNILWSVARQDGQPISSGTSFTNITGGTKDAVLKIGLAEATGTLVVTATHTDANGSYGIGTFEVVVTESTQVAALRSQIATVAANVTTGQYDATAKVTIDGVDWYVIAKDDDTNPTKALLYAANSLDYDGTATYKWSDTFGNDNKWVNSNIRKYLNGSFISGNTAYQGNSFADKYEYAFALAEPTDIYTRTTVDSNTQNGTADFTMTTDKVFLLSESDFYGTFRGRYNGTTYADIGAQSYDYTVRDSSGTGIKLWANATNDQRKDATNGQWTWLRSPINYDYRAAGVGTSGNLSGASYWDAGGALRPAFWVNLPSS